MYKKATRYPNNVEPLLLWTWLNNPTRYKDDYSDNGLDGKYLMYKC